MCCDTGRARSTSTPAESGWAWEMNATEKAAPSGRIGKNLAGLVCLLVRVVAAHLAAGPPMSLCRIIHYAKKMVGASLAALF